MTRFCILELLIFHWVLHYGGSIDEGWSKENASILLAFTCACSPYRAQIHRFDPQGWRWWMIYMTHMGEPLAVLLPHLYGSDFKVTCPHVDLTFKPLTISDCVVTPREYQTSLSPSLIRCFLLFFRNGQPDPVVK